MTKADETLLNQINKAIAEENEARTELVSRGKLVGQLLLEAKKRHPGVKEFTAFLGRINGGLHVSRAYDYMRLAGGRITDEELRKDARERKQKSREKKKLPPAAPRSLPQPEPKATPDKKPLSVTVTETADEEEFSAAEKASARHLNEFKFACRTYLPKMMEDDQYEALLFVQDYLKAEAKKRKAA